VTTLLALLGILVMLAALALIPLGVPGTWIMVGVLAIGAFAGRVGVAVLITCILIAAVAEVIEFVASKRMNERFGGSRGAFWGAIIGGIAGVVIGMPVPVIGSIIAGFLGSFIGAAAVTLYETRKYGSAWDVGIGALLGRIWAAVAKAGAGIVILVIGGVSLLWR
jgi:uncharacterized protein